MKTRIVLMSALALMCLNENLRAHCQMPCGIYHDDMVFDQIDQYIETMYKGISVLNENKFETVKDRNETVRWVLQKETASDEVANTITKYFLQQKIKPGEDNTATRLAAAHQLLFLIVAIKQNADLKMVKDFADEWEKFKNMFHFEGYECEMEKIKFKKREEEEAKEKSMLDKKQESNNAQEGSSQQVGIDNKNGHDHVHDHDHTH